MLGAVEASCWSYLCQLHGAAMRFVKDRDMRFLWAPPSITWPEEPGEKMVVFMDLDAGGRQAIDGIAPRAFACVPTPPQRRQRSQERARFVDDKPIGRCGRLKRRGPALATTHACRAWARVRHHTRHAPTARCAHAPLGVGLARRPVALLSPLGAV